MKYPLCGEVIAGELYVMGRPSQAHTTVEMELGYDLRHGGRGGPPPAGWYPLQEIEVLFATQEKAILDLSGWRTERIAGHRDENPVTVTPDWVCEVLSDSTRRKDLGAKRDLYARQGVPHLWSIDPDAHVLEAFALATGRGSLLGTWTGDAVATGVQPFPEYAFHLASWWLKP